MPRFRKKPVEVEARQWFPGVEIECLKYEKRRLLLSRDGTYFYVQAFDKGFRPNQWLGPKLDGPIPEEKKHGQLDGYVEFTLRSTGETYHRHALPFAFFSVKSGELIEVEPTDERWLDYCAAMQVEPKLLPYVETLEGRMTVSPGDWIIRGIKGEFYPCKPDIFAATYELVEEP